MERGQIVPRTHDLSALVGLCAAAGFPIEPIHEDCQRLQPYAVLTRYPGSPFEPDDAEARLAAEAARRIHEAVQEMLGDEAS